MKTTKGTFGNCTCSCP